VADDYRFEIGATYDRTQLESEQTATTNVGTIFTSNEVDTDAFSLFGSWYYAGLSDEKGPRARAAFVDRASVLNVRYARTDVSFSTSIASTDPLFPAFDGSFDSDGDVYAFDVRYVWRESGWFASGGVAQSDTSSVGLVAGSADATAWALGLGKYLFDNTTLALDISEVDEDVFDVTNIAVSFSHLGDMGEKWQYAVDLSYARTEGDFDLEFDTWSAALSLYPNRDFEFGLRVSEQDADFPVQGSTSYEGFASWFVTPRVSLAASYSVNDVDSFGVTGLPATQTSGDADQDSIGVSVSVRF
jgi:hypothetical protein